MSSLIKNYYAESERHRESLLNFPRELAERNRTNRLKKILTTFDFLKVKLENSGIQAVFDDLDLSDDESTEIVKKALQLSSHVLKEHPDQFHNQIISRLAHNPSPEINNILAQNRRLEPALVPVNKILVSPGEPLLKTIRTGWNMTIPRGLVLGTSDTVSRLHLLQDGQSILICRVRGIGLSIWNVHKVDEKTDELKMLEGFTARALCVIPDSDYLVVSAYEGDKKDEERQTILLQIDIGKKRIVRRFAEKVGLTNTYTALCSFPGDKRFIAAGNGLAEIFDLDTGHVQQVFETNRLHFDGHIKFVSILPDLNHIIFAGDYYIALWSLEKGEQIQSFRGCTEKMINDFGLDLRAHIKEVFVFPDGSRMATTNESNEFIVWDIQSGEILKFLEGYQGVPLAVAPCNKLLACANGYRLDFMDVEKGEIRHSYDGESDTFIDAVAMPDDRHIVSAHSGGKLKLWDSKRNPEAGGNQEHTGRVTDIVVLPDGKRFATASKDHLICIWDVKTCMVQKSLRGHTDGVEKLVLHPDGNRLISLGKDKTIRVWDLTEYRELHRFTYGGYDKIRDFTILPGGGYAVAIDNGYLQAWNLEGEKPAPYFGYPFKPFGYIALAAMPDGQHIVASRRRGLLQLIDFYSGNLIRSYGGDYDQSGYTGRNVIALPDGESFISDCGGYFPRLWNVNTGKFIELKFGGGSSHKFFLLPDGNRILISDSIVDLQTCENLVELEGASGVVFQGVTHDGNHAVSVNGNCLKLWNLTNGKVIAEYMSDISFQCAAFSQDQQMIIVGDAPGNVHFFRMENIDIHDEAAVYAWQIEKQTLIECPWCWNGKPVPRLGKKKCMNVSKNVVGDRIQCPSCGHGLKVHPVPIDRDTIRQTGVLACKDSLRPNKNQSFCELCEKYNSQSSLKIGKDFFVCEKCLKKIVSSSPNDWVTTLSESKKCISCPDKARAKSFYESPMGSICLDCVEEGIVSLASATDASATDDIVKILEGDADRIEKFIALIYLAENPDAGAKKRQCKEKLLDGAAELFHDDSQPIFDIERKLTIKAGVAMGEDFIPLLINKSNPDSSPETLVNLIEAASFTIPEDRHVLSLMEKAAGHDDVRVKRFMLDLAKKRMGALPGFILSMLKKDEDKKIREAATSIEEKHARRESVASDKKEDTIRSENTNRQPQALMQKIGLYAHTAISRYQKIKRWVGNRINKDKYSHLNWMSYTFKDFVKGKDWAIKSLENSFGRSEELPLLRKALKEKLMRDPGDVKGAENAAAVLNAPGLPAIALLSRKSYDSDELRKRLPGSKSPGVWTAWADRALRNRQCLENVETAYRKAIRLDPRFQPAWKGLGKLLKDHFLRYEEAEVALKKAIEYDPHELSSWKRQLWESLGDVLDKLKKYEESENAYRTAIEFSGESKYDEKKILVKLADLRENRLRKYQEAEKAYIRIIEIEGSESISSREYWEKYGDLLAGKLHRYIDAERAYLKISEHKSYEFAFWVKLGMLYHRNLDDWEKAEKAYRQALDQYTSNKKAEAAVWALLSDVLKRSQRPSEARSAYLKAAEIDPESVESLSKKPRP